MMQDSETSRPETNFAWVSDLPNYAGLLPVNVSTSSLLPRFSLFSLFRSKSTLPSQDQLDPLFACSNNDKVPTTKESHKALTCLADYISVLCTVCVTADAEEVEQWVLRAMEGYMIAVSVVARATFDAGMDDVDRDKLYQTVAQSLRGVFTIYNHFVGTSRPPVTSWLDKISANLLSSTHPAADANQHLVPLFAQTRDIISSLQHAARASSLKSTGSSSDAEAAKWEGMAEARMDWLRLFADHVRGLDRLEVSSAVQPIVGIDAMGKGKAKKVTKAQLKLREKEGQERPMRIAIEADILRCDLALSMATAKTGDIKRRAKSSLAAQLSVEGDEDQFKEEKPERSESPISRKRRALMDESDQETVVNDPDWETAVIEQTRETSMDAQNEKRWEDDVEVAMLETLSKVKDLLEGGHSDVLVAKIERNDWVPSHGGPAIEPSTTRDALRPGRPEAEDTDSASSSSDESEDSDTSGEDLSHPCPLRTLFRLHDRYEEQRLAVWMSLPAEERGRMTLYMRGVEGRVGTAWDMMGLRLLMEYDSMALEGYGLSPDKHDKWVELASRRNAKKINKRGRKTM